MGWQWGQCPWKHSPYIQVSDVLCYKPIHIKVKIDTNPLRVDVQKDNSYGVETN